MVAFVGTDSTPIEGRLIDNSNQVTILWSTVAGRLLGLHGSYISYVFLLQMLTSLVWHFYSSMQMITAEHIGNNLFLEWCDLGDQRNMTVIDVNILLIPAKSLHITWWRCSSLFPSDWTFVLAFPDSMILLEQVVIIQDPYNCINRLNT